MVMRLDSNSVCNHAARSGNPICLSQLWSQTELDDTKSYCQLILVNYNSEKRIAKLSKRENWHENTDKGGINCLYVIKGYKGCDWLI